MFKSKILLSAVGIILAWALVVPVFEFPDEQVHFATVDYVLTHGVVPAGNTPDVTREMYLTQELLGTLRSDLGQNRYTYHPEYHLEYSDSYVGRYETLIQSLNTPESRSSYVKSEGARYPLAYYRYSSFWLQAVDRADLLTRIFAVRFGSLPLALGMAYFTYQIGLLLFARPSIAASLVALTFFQPMFDFVTAGINSDNLHNFWFIALTYACLHLIKRGLTSSNALALTLIVVADIYTKPQGYLAVPIALLALLLSLFWRRKWRLLGIAAMILSVLLLLTHQVYLSYLLSPNHHGVDFGAFVQFSLNKLLSQNVVWYWGVFKWLGVVMPPIYWQLANRLVLLAAVGLIIYTWKVWRKKHLAVDPPLLTFMVVLALCYPLAIYWADWQHHKNVGYSLGIQARYFFPVIVAQLSLLLTGILSWGWNPRSTLYLKRGVVLFFLWLQLGGIWRILTSHYDTSSLTTLFLQLSQYKPAFAKGSWWYLWGLIYLISCLTILKTALVSDIPSLQPQSQKPKHNKKGANSK